jgi:hypothetical protein
VNLPDIPRLPIDRTASAQAWRFFLRPALNNLSEQTPHLPRRQYRQTAAKTSHLPAYISQFHQIMDVATRQTAIGKTKSGCTHKRVVALRK